MSFSEVDDSTHAQDNLNSHNNFNYSNQEEPYTAYTTIPRNAPGTPCCRTCDFLHEQHTSLFVTSATKVADGLTASSFVAYTIKIGDKEVRRRYSEFESLRKVLCRIYPTLIVPPIPEKHTISNYANIQNKSKEDAVIVEKRKRMLQKFLNRLAKHEILSYEHIFHRFLEPEATWSELMHSPPISTLPKNPMSAPLTASASAVSLSRSGSVPQSPVSATQPGLSGPASAGPPPPPLRQADPRFIDSEVFTQKFSNQLSGSMDRSQKKVVRKLGEIASDKSELGATLNGFSLSEYACVPLSNAIERVGQAVDSSFMATTELMQSLEVNVNEPMQEYIQYANIIKSILKFRHQKHIQSESTADQLESKRSNLENLERMEVEAKRLDSALNRERTVTASSTTTTSSTVQNEGDAPVQDHISEEGAFTNEPESTTESIENTESQNPYARNNSVGSTENGDSSNPYAHTHVLPTSTPKRRSTRINVFSALSHTLHGIIDVDPEATRRNNIGKTKDAIAELEGQLESTNEDLDNISRAVQGDLDRFQRQKIKDMREILLEYAKAHQRWCQKNLGSWSEAKQLVEDIPV
ncbi:Sorting nexin, cytoplasm-to-vacuole targeting pathway/endosomal sorting [Entomortierella beljakovae]|nr:Sorting nexin, cytoplasm-to-vacuole targeting pathway/endosomal sorting [Entomortierella beljakovae]